MLPIFGEIRDVFFMNLGGNLFDSILGIAVNFHNYSLLPP